MCFYCPTRVFI